MRELIPDLMMLFDGDRRAYGTYSAQLVQDGDKKKGIAASLKGDVTVDLWIRHLSGMQGLGIIPIDETSKVKFAAIDIDEYPIDLIALNANIQRLKLPLVLCRTKSGGAHLYLFLDAHHRADEVQLKMREMAALLGYGNSEIFPKQTKIVVDRGDVGSWINMPYFYAHLTERYALNELGQQMSFERFIEYARVRQIPFADLHKIASNNREILPGGPPCLNHLLSMEFPAGTRNNGLFNLAIYAQKAHGDEWRDHVIEYNQKYMTPPLTDVEVQGVIKSAAKKNFNYTCKQAPIANYCNMPKCRSCKHGIGVGDLGMPKFGSLTKLMTVPPIWFLEIEGGGRMELTTDDLQSPRNFQHRCMASLNIMPICMKQDAWQELIHKLLQDVTEIEIPPEATPEGQLWSHLEDFTTGRVQAKTVEELLMGKPFLKDGMYYFRLKDFIAYLDRQKWRAMPQSNIPMHIAEWGCGRQFFNVHRKGVNCYCIAEKEFEKQDAEFATPRMPVPEKVLS